MEPKRHVRNQRRIAHTPMNSIQFVKTLQDLPTLSAVANQINEAENKAALNAKSLSVIIKRDPALSSKILKLANSAYYGLAKEVKTIERAVTVLGFSTIKNLALTISVYKLFKSQMESCFDMEGLWHHSLGSAVAAKNLVLDAQADVNLAEQAFLGGILHDIGLIAFAHKMPEKMNEVLQMVSQMHSPLSEVEKDILGFTHQKVGGLLAQIWNFPEAYVHAIKHHHGDFPSTLDEDRDVATVVRAVFIGNQMSKVLKLGNSIEMTPEKIPVTVWQALGVHRQNLPAIRDKILTDYQALKESWNLQEEAA
ncbi:HDOD domain-containing protein [Thiovibrio sp. JS02]